MPRSTCLLAIPLLLLSSPRNHLAAAANVPEVGFADPRDGGGTWLTAVPDTFPAGLGEPVNIVISGKSDAAVLKDQENDGGLRNFFLSFDFSGECLGQHLGSSQGVNLGDGNGLKNETAVIRYNYGDQYTGSCQETVQGGNHFRYWVQNGKQNDTGAIFMAVSYEKPIAEGHDIVPNGYDFGRDLIVANATSSSSIDSQSLRAPTPANTTGNTTIEADPGNLPVITGSTSFNGYTYTTTATYLSGYLSNSSDSINHASTVGVNGRPAIDGLIAVLDVKITGKPSGSISFTAPQLLLQAVLCACTFSLVQGVL